MSESTKDSNEPLNMKQSDTLKEYLTSFTQFVEARQSQVERSTTADDPWLWTYDGGKSSFHLVVSVMIHGNEVGPLEGLLDIMDALDSGKLKYHGRLSCFIGNPKAARANRRFLDIDLNRIFDKDLVNSKIDQVKDQIDSGDRSATSSLPYEIQRVSEIFAILDQADLYIDFHQTIIDSSQAFYICPFSEEAWHWARILGGAKVWVTRHPQYVSGGLKCADEYVRQQGKASLALELGAAGFSAKARAGVWKSLNRAISAINRLSEGNLPQVSTSEQLGCIGPGKCINEDTETSFLFSGDLKDDDSARNEQSCVSLESLAADQPELTFYETSYRCSFEQSDYTLKSGLVNFQAVQKNEQVSENNTPPLQTPLTGVLLFPKYPERDDQGHVLEPRPKEIYRIVSLLTAHPRELWPDLFE